MYMLDGIRVVDLTRYVSGPHCSMLLAQMGAEVIKVEKPGTGDENRTFGPWYQGVSLSFGAYNMSKKSVTLDLRSDEGKERLWQLIDTADVVLENFRPGLLEKMGFSYEALSARNPGVILASISGFGQDGPYRDRPCFDGIAQAMGGMLDAMEESCGKPAIVPGYIGDSLAGMYAALAISGALVCRARTGKGDRLDIDMLSSVASLYPFKAANYMLNGEIHPALTYGPVDNFETTDGKVRIDIGSNNMFGRLSQLFDDEIFRDPQYRDINNRLRDWRPICDALQVHVRKLSCEEVQRLFDGVGITVGIIYTVDRLCRDPHLNARDHFTHLHYDGVDAEVRYPKLPFRSRTCEQRYERAPGLGEHNKEFFPEG